MGTPVISLKDVSKRYPGGRDALSGISMDIEPGEFVFFTGHSGAGKSTLFRLIAAIERPTRGSVVVAGQNVSSLSRHGIPFLRRNLGLVFQDQKLLNDRSVFDNVMLPLREYTDLTEPQIDTLARFKLALVGLDGAFDASPAALSGGMVPCQTALVMMLSAVAAQKVVLGLALRREGDR